MDKSWYDDLRAIGSQIKAGYSEDLTGNAGQAMKAFSPKDSAVYQKGQELVEEAANTAKENASDYEGRGAIAKPIIRAVRFVSGLTSPIVASAPLMVSPFAQAVTLGLLTGGSAGQKAYEKHKDTSEGIVAGASSGVIGALMTPATFAKGGLSNITPSGSAEATRSAGRATERGFARLVNESGLASRKYDKFAANKANATDRVKTVSEQGLKTLPANAKSKADAKRISELQDFWRGSGKTESEIEQLIQKYWAKRMI
jgi:hypothetical protein